MGQGLGTACQRPTPAYQWGHSLPKGGVEPLDEGRINRLPPPRLLTELASQLGVALSDHSLNLPPLPPAFLDHLSDDDFSPDKPARALSRQAMPGTKYPLSRFQIHIQPLHR